MKNLHFFLIFLTTSSLPGVTYFEVFTELQASGGVPGPFLDTVASDGTSVYSFTRAASGGVDESNISRFSGGSFSTVVDTAAWNAARVGTFESTGSNGAGVTSSGDLRFINFFDNSFYNVNTGTGAVSVITPSSDISQFVGGTANLPAFYEVQADGSAFAVESVTDQILAFSPAGAISTAVSSLELAAGIGGTSIGGIGFDGNLLLVGSNSNDSLVGFSGGVSSIVLSTAQIEAVTDDIDGRVGFGDIFAAPNGLVYFYESDSDYILSYDPADPAGSLAAVISEADLGAGPGSDTINQMSWYQGKLAWVDASLGYYVIPEPSTALLGLLGVPLLLRRRRSCYLA